LKKEVRIFCPATVANVNCGFDALGFALDGVGDEMVFQKTTQKGISITAITGADLPSDPKKNVAGVAGQSLLDAVNADFGVAIEIHKKIRPGSGIGSSSASAAGAVYGINQLLEHPVSPLALTRHAMKGEALASGNEHADNVAPCLYGGITLVSGYTPLQIVALPSLDSVFVGIIHPHIVIHTKQARALLPTQVPLKDAITQAQKLAGFVASLYEWDKALFSQSLKDVLITPHRKTLIPHYDQIESCAIHHNCIAFGISGSGPSLFALAFAKADIDQFLESSTKIFKKHQLQVDTYSSSISGQGCHII
jgi:homoserine kinase